MQDFEFHPYSPARLEETLAFIHQFPLLPYGESQSRFFLSDLIRDPSCVFDLRWGNQARVVAFLLDTCDNEDNTAELVFLAAHGDLPPRAWEILFDRGEQAARGGPRDGLDVTCDPEFSIFLAELLRTRGYGEQDATYWMEKSSEDEPGANLPVPLVWKEVTEQTVRLYYELMRGAFAGQSGVNYPAFDAFCEAALACDILPRLLMDETEAIAFVKVKKVTAKRGEILTLGRSPSRRGQRLGNLAIREACRLLHSHGARNFELSVSAANAPAIRLYEQAGFVRRRSFTNFRTGFK